MQIEVVREGTSYELELWLAQLPQNVDARFAAVVSPANRAFWRGRLLDGRHDVELLTHYYQLEGHPWDGVVLAIPGTSAELARTIRPAVADRGGWVWRVTPG